MNPVVIYEDALFIAVEKPSGWLCHASVDRTRPDVTRWLQESHPDALLLHRLDFETSGVMLFARGAHAAELGRKLFAERRIRKTYFAVVEGKKVDPRWTIKNYLKAEGSGAKAKMVATRSGGDLAETEFVLRVVKGPWALVEARPLTGRRHQIRAHLAGSGHALWGDVRYGGKKRAGSGGAPGGFLLHAWRLQFEHPETKKPILIESALPKPFLDLGFGLK